MSNHNVKNTTLNTYRPCIGRSISLCLTTFSLAIFSFIVSSQIKADRIIFIWIGIILSVLHVITVLYSVFKLNSGILVEEDHISQKQFLSAVVIKYDDVTDVRLSHSPLVKSPPLITIHSTNQKISFETTSKVYREFRDRCNNDALQERVNVILRQNLIYD